MEDPLIKIEYSDGIYKVYNETELLQETDTLNVDTIDFYICIEEAKKAGYSVVEFDTCYINLRDEHGELVSIDTNDWIKGDLSSFDKAKRYGNKLKDW